jgi:hypothetical protein
VSAFVDAASLAVIIGPITTLLSGVAGYWLAGRNDEARDRRAMSREESARRAALADRLEEDRHTFQRDTLLELQDELQSLARITTRILLQDEKTVREHGRIYQLPEGLSDEEFQAFTAVQRTWVRVLDPELRSAVEGFTAVCSRAGLPNFGGGKEELLEEVRRREGQVAYYYGRVNDLLGERLRRELDRRFLAEQSLKSPGASE